MEKIGNSVQYNQFVSIASIFFIRIQKNISILKYFVVLVSVASHINLPMCVYAYVLT